MTVVRLTSHMAHILFLGCDDHWGVWIWRRAHPWRNFRIVALQFQFSRGNFDDIRPNQIKASAIASNGAGVACPCGPH